jgi:hypothetical protein
VVGRIKKLDTHTHEKDCQEGTCRERKSQRETFFGEKKTPLDEENERRRTRKETDRNSRVVSEEKEVVVDSLLTKNPEGKINNVDCRQPVLPFLVLSRSPLLLLLL